MDSSGERTGGPFRRRDHRAVVLHGAACEGRSGGRLATRRAQGLWQGHPGDGTGRTSEKPVPRPPALELPIEYNRRAHREISCSPVERFAQASDVLRPSPSSSALRDAFRMEGSRAQRQSDGTISVEGVRFEIPGRYRHFRKVSVRYARWDLSRVDLVDPRSGTILSPLYPLDRKANADGQALRERWRAHLTSSRIKPVLLVDEAQEMSVEVLNELRILSSADFDARSLLTVVLCGDGRFLERLRHPDLVPLASRIRTRLSTEAASREELSELLSHALAKAGNATLLTAELRDTLVDHAAGNYRLLMTMSDELLTYGMAHEAAQLDEKSYLEVFQPTRPRGASKKKART